MPVEGPDTSMFSRMARSAHRETMGGSGTFLRAMAVFTLAAVMALVPLSLDVNPVDSHGVQVHKCEAHAAVVGKPSDYLRLLAGASGLSEQDFVVTTGLALAGGTGLSIFSNNVNFGASSALSVINQVVTSAEWPSWQLAPQSTKDYYGSEAEYEYARFLSYLSAFGLAESRDNFYSRGGSIDEGAESIASRIGAIGSNWISGFHVPFLDVKSLLPDFSEYYPVRKLSTGLVSYNGTIGTLPNPVYVNYGSEFSFQDNLFTYHFNQNVYMVVFANSNSSKMYQCFFSDKAFQFYMNSNTGSVTRSTDYTFDNRTVQWIGGDFSGSSDWHKNSNAVWNPGISRLSSSDSKTLAWRLFYDLAAGDLPGPKNIPDTPSDIANEGFGDDDTIGMPSEGIGPDTSYPTLNNSGSEPVVPTPRPDNPYNPENPDKPGYQSGTPEWEQETTENVLPLMNIRFGELFPFSLLADIPRLHEKVQSVTGEQINGGVYNMISVPIVWAEDQNDEMLLDLSWLHSLLLMVRPWLQILLAAVLLITTIEFWRGILTG